MKGLTRNRQTRSPPFLVTRQLPHDHFVVFFSARVLGIVSCVGIAVLTWASFDHGNSASICANCGATMHERYFSLFGTDWSYERLLREGPVSKFIQAHEGRECSHQWEAARGGSQHGSRWSANGLSRYLTVGTLEGTPGILVVLKKREVTEPGFVSEFTQFIRLPNPDRSSPFVQELTEQAWIHPCGEDQTPIR